MIWGGCDFGDFFDLGIDFGCAFCDFGDVGDLGGMLLILKFGGVFAGGATPPPDRPFSLGGFAPQNRPKDSG